MIDNWHAILSCYVKYCFTRLVLDVIAQKVCCYDVLKFVLDFIPLDKADAYLCRFAIQFNIQVSVQYSEVHWYSIVLYFTYSYIQY